MVNRSVNSCMTKRSRKLLTAARTDLESGGCVQVALSRAEPPALAEISSLIAGEKRL